MHDDRSASLNDLVCPGDGHRGRPAGDKARSATLAELVAAFVEISVKKQKQALKLVQQLNAE